MKEPAGRPTGIIVALASLLANQSCAAGIHAKQFINSIDPERTVTSPEAVEHGSPRTLREKLIKIGAKVVRHGRYITFQLAEFALPAIRSPTPRAASTGSDRGLLPRPQPKAPARPFHFLEVRWQSVGPKGRLVADLRVDPVQDANGFTHQTHVTCPVGLPMHHISPV